MYEGVKTFLFSDQLSQSHFNIKKLGVVPYRIIYFSLNYTM